MEVISAHVVQVPAPSLFSLLRLDSVPIDPSLSDCVTTGDLRKPQHSELHESMVSLAVAVEFLSVPTPLGDFSDEFVAAILEILFLEEYTKSLGGPCPLLRFSGKVWQWNPRCVIGGMLAVANVWKPTSEYGEEIACCLSLAQEAREQGAGQMLTPAVVSLRKTKLVVVIADMREERVLERVGANVLALLQGNGYGYGEAWGGFKVYVARWDITKAAERLEFTQFVAALGTYFLSAG